MFLWALTAHLSAWAIAMTTNHLETVFHYRALQQINGLERRDMTAALIQKNHQEYHSKESGTYLSGFTNDIAQMEQLGLEPFFNLFGTVSLIISSLIALAALHWSLMALSLILGGIMILIPKVFDKKLSQAGENCSKQQALAVSSFKDLLMGYDVLQSFDKIQHLYKGTAYANKQMELPRYKLKVLKSLVGNGMAFVSVICQVLVCLLAGILILMGQINLSVMVSVSTICAQVYNGLKDLVNLQLSFSAGKPYFKHITVHDDGTSEKTETKITPFSHSIEVKDLTFHYDKKPVLENISFSFEKGKKYALTGPSGCGKSTLLKLILGWLTDYQGKILFDGRNIRTLSPDALKKQISYIEQNVFLFNTSIRENITLGESFTEKQLNDAIKKSALVNDLSAMPDGLETIVGEEGRNLSDGQKQRVAIAGSHPQPLNLVSG